MMTTTIRLHTADIDDGQQVIRGWKLDHIETPSGYKFSIVKSDAKWTCGQLDFIITAKAAHLARELAAKLIEAADFEEARATVGQTVDVTA